MPTTKDNEHALYIFVPKHLHHEFKAEAARRGMTMKALLREVMERTVLLSKAGQA